MRNRENKYYIPDISEFHVGFSYEEAELTDWVKKKFNWTSSLGKHPKNFRVKYLSREDIESCGFICTKIGSIEEEYQMQKYKDGWLCLTHCEGQVMIEYEYPTDTIGHVTSYTLFDGIIKNLSELKVLLNQLGVEYD